MKVNKIVSGNRMELALEGKFDAVSAPKFEAEITECLDGITELDIDLSAIEYISSAGLRALLFLQQTLNEVEGTMTVRNVPEVVMNIFEITGFTGIIKVV